MKLAIVHYHLNRGGVTQVIVNHLRALNGQAPGTSRMPVALLYGGRCEGWPTELADELPSLELSLHAVDELDYDNVRPNQVDLAAKLQSTLLQAGFPPRETILHVHNHSLGKNAALSAALAELARRGYALLLHIHDFAEDFRPDNYHKTAFLPHDTGDDLSGSLYPQAPQVHYAVLNSRDHRILLGTGIDATRLHLLPNAVPDIGLLPPREKARAKLADRFSIPVDDRFILYPVRGIRRKNLGEALLWSALAEKKTYFGLTLPPLNPVEQPSYLRWKQLAEENGLPWRFEVGGAGGLAFTDNLAAADSILTTSVAEGFGLVFLEAWLAGRPLIGRDLPEITADFVGAGVRFPGLGPNLWVPVDWLGEESFRADIAAAYQQVLTAYRQPPPPIDALRRAVDGLIRDGLVDFGSCGTSMQRLVVERVAASSTDRERLLEINPWVGDALAMCAADRALIEQNAEIVRTQYSLASCGRRLWDLYEQMIASGFDDQLQPAANVHHILESFLELSRFHPLRVES